MKPYPGLIVHFAPEAPVLGAHVMAALVTAVNHDGSVNLSVFLPLGGSYSIHAVRHAAEMTHGRWSYINIERAA